MYSAGERRVTIPYAEALAEQTECLTIRIRRDFPKLLTLIAASAILQAVLRTDPSDPNRLDTDRDGVACESNRAPFDREPVRR